MPYKQQKERLYTFISAWAIALSVLQYRAMREPLDVGRAAEVPTLFLCRHPNPELTQNNHPFLGTNGQNYDGNEKQTDFIQQRIEAGVHVPIEFI